MSRAAFGPGPATVAFGIAVRDRREQHEWTQAELAERAGERFTQNIVTKIERGTVNVNVEQVHALARALRVKPGTLLADATAE